MRFFLTTLVLGALCFQHARAQGTIWSISAGPSYHSFDYAEPLPWWDPTGLLFPSMTLRAEWPMTFVEGPLAEKLFFGTGLRYVRLASRVDWRSEVNNGAQVFTGQFQISEHYLTVPLQVRLDIGKTPLFLVAGPELGVLVLAKKKSDTLSPEESRSSQSENVGADLNRLQIALYGGLGAHISKAVGVFARYGASLRDAKKDDERPVLISDWRAREVEFGIQIQIKRR